jgi:hypothetical protein
MDFEFTYENKRMKPAIIVQKRKRAGDRNMEG